MAISRKKEARSRDYAPLLFRMTSRILYSAQYHRQHCTLHAFEQFGALYMHNHDDKYPSRPVFERGTPRLQAPVDTNEPSGRPVFITIYLHKLWMSNYNISTCVSLPTTTTWPYAMHWSNAGAMLVNRLRRWPSIGPTLGQCIVSVMMWPRLIVRSIYPAKW